MVVVNRRTPPAELQRIVFNLSTKGVRHAKLNGRDHIVVPAVMMTEGVHEGSGGPGYYSEAALAASDFAWNHMPIVVYHSQDAEGKPVSARTEDVLNSAKIGLVLNTKTKNKKQRIEAWLDYKLTKKVDPRIIESIENGEKVEVSTGIGLKKTKKKGKWGDEKYTWEATVGTIVPDHLAVLPDQVGACSVKDGAGLLQLNAALKNVPDVSRRVLLRSVRNAAKPFGAKFVKNEMSFSQQSSAVCEALAAAYGEKGKYWRGWVVEIYPTYVIFATDYEGTYWKVSYTVSKGGVSLSDDKTQVVRTTEYKAVRNAADKKIVTNGGSQMKPEFKKKYRTALIANGLSKKAVLALEDGDLRAAYKATRKAAEPAAKKEPAKQVVNRKVVVNGKKMSRDEVLDLLTPRERAVITNGIKAAEKARAKNIEIVKAHPANPFKDELLANAELMPDSLLEGIAILAAAKPAASDDDDDPYLKADYSGANGVANAKGGKDDDLPEPLLLGIYNGLKPEKATA